VAGGAVTGETLERGLKVCCSPVPEPMEWLKNLALKQNWRSGAGGECSLHPRLGTAPKRNEGYSLRSQQGT